MLYLNKFMFKQNIILLIHILKNLNFMILKICQTNYKVKKYSEISEHHDNTNTLSDRSNMQILRLYLN